MITLETNLGKIKIALDTENTPNTAENFSQYVRDGFYDGLIFHRVISGFMIQGGGLTEDMSERANKNPIQNEAHKDNKNTRGTLAMARTSDPHSATSQFFINLVDNSFLNFSKATPDGWGYCVFGQVTEGMDIVDKIGLVETTSHAGHQDVPVEPITIIKAHISE